MIKEFCHSELMPVIEQYLIDNQNLFDESAEELFGPTSTKPFQDEMYVFANRLVKDDGIFDLIELINEDFECLPGNETLKDFGLSWPLLHIITRNQVLTEKLTKCVVKKQKITKNQIKLVEYYVAMLSDDFSIDDRITSKSIIQQRNYPVCDDYGCMALEKFGDCMFPLQMSIDKSYWVEKAFKNKDWEAIYGENSDLLVIK